MKRILILVACLLPIYLLPHGVNVFAYQEGDSIFIQAYFSSGDAVKNGKIEIFDQKGNLLLVDTTDNNGNLTVPAEEGMYKIVLNAGMGHRAETYLEEDVPEKAEGSKNSTISSGDLKEIRDLIIQMERRRMIVTQIFGGIGYIFGILGMWLFFRERYGRKG